MAEIGNDEFKRPLPVGENNSPEIRRVKKVYFDGNKMAPSINVESPFKNSWKVYFCENCLEPLDTKYFYKIHMKECSYQQPPGKEIYRKDEISIWELDGALGIKYYDQKSYTENLSFLSKFFIDRKSLGDDDVERFYFYVLTKVNLTGVHVIGYFSREKESDVCNLNTILILPPYRRNGYGKLLVDLSYELSRTEGMPGTPEEPLTYCAKSLYFSYWSTILLDLLFFYTGHILIEDLSNMTGIAIKDIITTLQYYDMIEYKNSRYLIEGMRGTDKDKNKIKHAPPQLKRRISLENLKWTPPKYRF